MKAIVLERPGGVENFRIEDIPTAMLKGEEVLVKVKAISINPVDYKVRTIEAALKGIYGDYPTIILGWDIAGEVVETGQGVTSLKKGDRVFGMVNFPGKGDAYAEYVAAPADQLAVIPETISFEAAAATTLAALTALQVLAGRVQTGDRVLIHAGSGGVGHFAIQIAKSLGAYVITTSSAKNRDFVLALGADEHIDYRAQAFEEVVSDVDFVFDMFNGEILYKSLQITKVGGTVFSIPTADFSEAAVALAQERQLDLSFHMVQSSGQDMKQLSTMLAKGELKPHISKVFSFEEMGLAHLQQESGRTVGKIIVRL